MGRVVTGQVGVTDELSHSARRESISPLVVVLHSLFLPASVTAEHDDHDSIAARCFVPAPSLYDEKHKEDSGMRSLSSQCALIHPNTLAK